MKKLLSMISAFGLTLMSTTSIVSCTSHSSEDDYVIDVGKMQFTNIYVKVKNRDNLTQADIDKAKIQAKDSIQADLLKYNKNADIDRDVRLEFDDLIHAPNGSNIYIWHHGRWHQ
ncbi:lipoprotein [Spiroplasma endosymbiont of Labia minor]|uniref:lipoprotein n=1 Tax=Spiroplasma endosymbiont of Labia minor TaxID=3066305 RepID=UPI0030D333BD